MSNIAFDELYNDALNTLSNMNDYYTEEEQRQLYAALKKKLNL
jgi:hypothetical protein